MQFIDPEAGAFPKRFYRALVCDGASGLQIGTITQLPDGRVQFAFTGALGRSYLIQASTNLTDWQDVSTITASGGTLSYTNSPGSGSPHRFFRLKSP